MHVAVLGAGIMGCCAALALAERGCRVTLFERNAKLLTEASLHNEGKLHLGFVYAADPSFRTAALMQKGAQAFMPTLSRWVPSAKLEAMMGRPFDYAIHRDSMLPPEAIARHMAKVAAAWRGNPAWAACRLLSPGELAARYDPEHVLAAYETGEVAIDTWGVATELTLALEAEPRIELRNGVSVTSVAARRGGHAVLGMDAHGMIEDGPFDAVANCLWANRVTVDIASGLPSPAPFLTRFKASVNLHCPGGVPSDLPSITLFLGPFGDVVAWPGGRVYLSWYPACLAGTTQDVAQIDWRDVRAGLDTAAIAEATIASLARICPAVVAMRGAAAGPPQVEGGAIFALGETDIDDHASRLHERHQVGLVASHGTYHSLDTGKYTLAPLLALELAQRIVPARVGAVTK
jgi:hypothetical protein